MALSQITLYLSLSPEQDFLLNHTHLEASSQILQCHHVFYIYSWSQLLHWFCRFLHYKGLVPNCPHYQGYVWKNTLVAKVMMDITVCAHTFSETGYWGHAHEQGLVPDYQHYQGLNNGVLNHLTDTTVLFRVPSQITTYTLHLMFKITGSVPYDPGLCSKSQLKDWRAPDQGCVPNRSMYRVITSCCSVGYGKYDLGSCPKSLSFTRSHQGLVPNHIHTSC